MRPNSELTSRGWLALVIGNSRLHWGFFSGGKLRQVWHSQHLTKSFTGAELPERISHLVGGRLPLYIASVVPQQMAFWQTYQPQTILTLEDIPLQGVYSTLGIDRALAVWGAGQVYRFPVLVIDGGTAVTFTGVDGERILQGGAILPGLQSQLDCLGAKTAALPKVELPPDLPSPWATTTPAAIASGVIHVLLAGIADFITSWRQNFPHSAVVFTGGDGELLAHYWQLKYPNLTNNLLVDSQLIFWGINSLIID